jgi:hypothetical protein
MSAKLPIAVVCDRCGATSRPAAARCWVCANPLAASPSAPFERGQGRSMGGRIAYASLAVLCIAAGALLCYAVMVALWVITCFGTESPTFFGNLPLLVACSLFVMSWLAATLWWRKNA